MCVRACVCLGLSRARVKVERETVCECVHARLCKGNLGSLIVSHYGFIIPPFFFPFQNALPLL